METAVASPRNLSRSLQRQVELATAICQERLMAVHARHLLAFVDLVSDRLPFDQAIEIYTRVLELNPEQARNLASRVLAELGQRLGVSERPLPAEPGSVDETEAEEPEPPGRPGALLAKLGRRLRGRRQEDLRYRINLAAARAEDAIFDTHVDNALLFVRALGEELPPPEAIDLYVETMMLPEGYADVVYHRALRIVAEQVLPPLPSEGETAVPSTT